MTYPFCGVFCESFDFGEIHDEKIIRSEISRCLYQIDHSITGTVIEIVPLKTQLKSETKRIIKTVFVDTRDKKPMVITHIV